jgi:hypothetical protein
MGDSRDMKPSVKDRNFRLRYKDIILIVHENYVQILTNLHCSLGILCLDNYICAAVHVSLLRRAKPGTDNARNDAHAPLVQPYPMMATAP